MDYIVGFGIVFEILDSKKTAKELSQKFELSTRTISRYIDSLSGAGVPIISKQGKYGGYEIDKHFKLNNYFFTKTEKDFLCDILLKQNNFNSRVLALKIKSMGTLS